MDAALLSRIDFLQLAIHLGGNKAVIKQMLELFMKSADESLAVLEKAEHEGNVILWLQTAHKLKGASKNITAKRLAGLCLEAEEIKSLPHQQSSAILYHIQKEIAILRDTIAKHLSDA